MRRKLVLLTALLLAATALAVCPHSSSNPPDNVEEIPHKAPSF